MSRFNHVHMLKADHSSYKPMIPCLKSSAKKQGKGLHHLSSPPLLEHRACFDWQAAVIQAGVLQTSWPWVDVVGENIDCYWGKNGVLCVVRTISSCNRRRGANSVDPRVRYRQGKESSAGLKGASCLPVDGGIARYRERRS